MNTTTLRATRTRAVPALLAFFTFIASAPRLDAVTSSWSPIGPR